MNAHILLGNVLVFVGEWGAARTHLEQGLVLYNAQQHGAYDPLNTAYVRVFGLSRLAQVLWSLGYPDQALQRGHEALTLAREQAQPTRLAAALIYAAGLHRCRREGHITYELAEATLILSREQGLPQRLAEATILRGWALVAQGHGEAEIAQIRQGLAARRATGVEDASNLGVLAEASRKVGQTEEGLRVIAEALAIRNRSGEGRGWPELYRLKGELLLKQAMVDEEQAEACFRQALDVACRQEAKSLELRAATSLARLWQQQGKRQEAHNLLAPVYGWFTEGFATADLKDAKALLEALQEERS